MKTGNLAELNVDSIGNENGLSHKEENALRSFFKKRKVSVNKDKK